MKKFLVLVSCILLSSVGACSPYVYDQEIEKFSSGVGSVNSAYVSGQQAVSMLASKDKISDYSKARRKLFIESGCRDTSAKPPHLPSCDVMVSPNDQSPLTGQTNSELTAQDKLSTATQTFSSLSSYAASLLAVVNASDETNLSKASQNLLSATDALSTAVASDKGVQPSTHAVVSSSFSLLAWSETAILNQKRFEVLRNVVPETQPSIEVLAKTITDALLLVRQTELQHMASDLNIAMEPFANGEVTKSSQADYQTKLISIQAKIANFNEARNVDPETTVAAMVKAHKDLATALANDEGQDDAVFESSISFVTVAGQLKHSMDAGSHQ